ncbi:MAG: hypothetical protein IPJ65_09840 [Archangiaceae bacterium]|nr:hypothetical protein [Archangiaceae bacterium]
MPTEEQCRDAVQALYRVRAVEKPPGLDGHREIWHRATRGAELLSTVDPSGRLDDQELTLFKEVFYWRRGGGMKTGKLVGDSDVSSRGNTLWDAAPAPVRLNRAGKALSSYLGDDAYLLHFRDAIAATLAGLEWDEKRVVTHPIMPGDSQELAAPPQDGPLKKLLRALLKKLSLR